MSHIYNNTYTGQSGGKINYLLNNYDRISLLAIGNSRCAHHIVPNQISSSAYNLSHNGMSLIFHTGLIDQLVNNEDIKIDTILLHIETHEAYKASSASRKDIQHLKYYFDKNKWVKDEISKLSRFEAIKYWFSSYMWNGKLMSVINNRIKSELLVAPEKGYVATLPTNRDSINVVWSLNKSKSIQGREVGAVNNEFEKYINHVKKICDVNNVTLMCFTSPIYNHSVSLNKDSFVELSNYFKDKDIPYFNYYNDNNLGLQSIWNWKDASHLNQKGAIIFTKKIRRDIKKLQ